MAPKKPAEAKPRPKTPAPSLAQFAIEAKLAGSSLAPEPRPQPSADDGVVDAAKGLGIDLKKAARAGAAEEAHPEIHLCPNCGAFIDPKAASCEHCGIAFEDGRPEAAPKAEALPEAVPPEAPAAPVPTAPPARAAKGKAKRAKAPAAKSSRKKR